MKKPLTSLQIYSILIKLRQHQIAYGAVAQLGERYTGSVEVGGSSPLSSTTKNP